MSRIAEKFAAGAARYEQATPIQRIVAERLAARLTGRPRRILEVGCGTGYLSRHLCRQFPEADLLLTDIAVPMLERCQANLGAGPHFAQMDGAHPPKDIGTFDLIVSSLAMQWFDDLQAGLGRLTAHLAPGGHLAFATLGANSFVEWRTLCGQLVIPNGLHNYPGVSSFPWPEGGRGEVIEETMLERHADGRAFLRALKIIGAGAARADHRPASPAALRRALAATQTGFSVSYHVLYGGFTRPSSPGER